MPAGPTYLSGSAARWSSTVSSMRRSRPASKTWKRATRATANAAKGLESLNPAAPIGVFDSGVGGLSVLRALMAQLPHEDFIYVGDTARLPYGSKPAAMVRGFAFEWTKELIARGAKAVVVACNSASSASLPDLAQQAPVPVYGVIDAGVAAALAHHQSGSAGVIGTERTIAAASYQQGLERAGLRVWAKACPLFVPMVEEGIADSDIALLVAEHYLRDRPRDLRTLILGCTHYPALSSTLQQLLGEEVTLVDTAETTALAVAAELGQLGLLRAAEANRQRQLSQLITGDSASFAHVAERLGGPVGDVSALPHPRPKRPDWGPA